MSQRETFLKPLALTSIAGVNERVANVELPPTEYSVLQGAFPEFATLQSRIWGKQLLKKYDFPIYGIHQFWTPQGYGGGLYQFQGSLDYGYWLTPTSNFDLGIPPLPIDGGGMTTDEFGYTYGPSGGYGSPNNCVISFLNNSTDHSACAPAPVPAGPSNPANGGPAGQGKGLKWESVTTDIDITDFMLSKTRSTTGGYSTHTVTENVGRTDLGCSITPSNPPDLGPFPSFGNYVNFTPLGALACESDIAATWAFLPFHTIPGCDGQVSVDTFTEPACYNERAILNFSGLIGVGSNVVLITMLRTTPAGASEVPIFTAPGDLTLDIPVDMEPLAQSGALVHPSFGTTTQDRFCHISQVRVYNRQLTAV